MFLFKRNAQDSYWALESAWIKTAVNVIKIYGFFYVCDTFSVLSALLHSDRMLSVTFTLQ